MADRFDEIKEILEEDGSGETLNRLRKEINQSYVGPTDRSIVKPKFEIVSGFEDAKLPTRATPGSAGYDFYACLKTHLPSRSYTYVPTGIKVRMPPNMVLLLFIRSSLSKDGWTLANGVGVVDSDYYENSKNEGHILGMVYNRNNQYVKGQYLEKGQRFMQGIFLNYHLAETDIVREAKRKGGFGSTGE